MPSTSPTSTPNLALMSTLILGTLASLLGLLLYHGVTGTSIDKERGRTEDGDEMDNGNEFELDSSAEALLDMEAEIKVSSDFGPTFGIDMEAERKAVIQVLESPELLNPDVEGRMEAEEDTVCQCLALSMPTEAVRFPNLDAVKGQLNSWEDEIEIPLSNPRPLGQNFPQPDIGMSSHPFLCHAFPFSRLMALSLPMRKYSSNYHFQSRFQAPYNDFMDHSIRFLEPLIPLDSPAMRGCYNVLPLERLTEDKWRRIFREAQSKKEREQYYGIRHAQPLTSTIFQTPYTDDGLAFGSESFNPINPLNRPNRPSRRNRKQRKEKDYRRPHQIPSDTEKSSYEDDRKITLRKGKGKHYTPCAMFFDTESDSSYDNDQINQCKGKGEGKGKKHSLATPKKPNRKGKGKKRSPDAYERIDHGNIPASGTIITSSSSSVSPTGFTTDEGWEPDDFPSIRLSSPNPNVRYRRSGRGGFSFSMHTRAPREPEDGDRQPPRPKVPEVSIEEIEDQSFAVGDGLPPPPSECRRTYEHRIEDEDIAECNKSSWRERREEEAWARANRAEYPRSERDPDFEEPIPDYDPHIHGPSPHPESPYNRCHYHHPYERGSSTNKFGTKEFQEDYEHRSYPAPHSRTMSPGRYGTAKTELEMEVERRRLNRRRDVSKERSRSPSLPIPPLRHEMREYHPNDLENELRCRPYDRGNHRGNHLGPHNPGWGGQGEREGGHIDHGLGVVTITPPRGWEEWYAAMDRKEAEERRGDHGRGGRIHRAEGPKTPPEGWIEYAQQWYDDEYRGQAGGRGDFETQGGDPRRGIRPRVGGHCGERTHPRENPHTRTDTDARAHTHHRVHTHHHVLHPEECIQEVMAPPHAQTPSPLPVPPVTFPHNPLPEQHQSPAQTAANPSVQFYSSYSDLDPNFYPQFYPHAVPENPNYYVAYDPFKPPQPPRQVLHYSEHCWILGQDHDPPPHDQPQEPHRQLWYEPYPGPLNLYHAPHRPVPVPAPSPAPQAPQSRQPHQGPDSRARARAKTSPAIPSPRRASIFGRPPALQHDRLKSNAYYLPLLNYLRLPPPIYLRPPPFPAPHAPHNYPRPRASPSRPRSAPPLWGPNGRSRQPEGTTNKGRGYGYDTTGVAPPPGNPPNNSGTGQHRMHKPTRPQAERSHAARDRTSAAGEAEGGQRWEEDGELRMRAAGPAGYDGMHADERYRVVSRNGRAVRDV